MTFDQHRLELMRRLSLGWPFDQIEDWVDGVDAPNDVKAALWLFAFGCQGRSIQRRVVDQALTEIHD
jgi:hypothetical protein